jgi:putative phosphoesterase
MRYGVIADIHANLHALDAVLRAIADDRVEGFICAGDVVGYGALPNECVSRVAEIGAVCVAGDHDLIALGRLSDARRPRAVRENLRWTRGVLSDESRRYLGGLQLRREVDRFVIAHGAIGDPSEQLHTPEAAAAELDDLPVGARGLVAGNTHQPISLSHDGRLFLNPGSVGRSTERDATARFAVLDTDAGEATLRATPYDVEAAKAVLRFAGLSPRGVHQPPSLFARLRHYSPKQ